MTMQISSNRRPPSTDADTRLQIDLMLLAPVLMAGRCGLDEAMTDRFMREVVRYHHTLPERAETQRAYAAHLDSVLHASQLPPGEEVGAVRAVAAAHGRAGAAAGVPLAIQVEFYRLGLPVLWEAALRRTRDGASAMSVTDAVAVLGRLQDIWVESMTAAYHRESREAIRSRDRRRSSLVGSLLDGGVHGAAELGDVADALRLPPDSCYVVVCLEMVSTGQDEVRVVENRLSRAGISSAWRLLPEGQSVVAGIAAVGGAAGAGVLTGVLSEAWAHRAGISPQFGTLDKAHRAVRFARLAMAGAPRGSGRVTVFEQALVAVVAASAPDVFTEVGRTVLGSLNQLPDEDREILIGTLRTWLTNGGSTEATAKVLFCHPNTVRYRLNRVTEHTGRSLTDPQSITELTLALHSDQLSRCA